MFSGQLLVWQLLVDMLLFHIFIETSHFDSKQRPQAVYTHNTYTAQVLSINSTNQAEGTLSSIKRQ